MQEAIRLIEDVFFGLGIIRIIIRNDLDNHASVQTAQASNYILEGVARKDKWNPIFNEYRDLNIWVKIKETASN